MTQTGRTTDQVIADVRRQTALDRAISYHTIREATPAAVVETAHIFERYLRGDIDSLAQA